MTMGVTICKFLALVLGIVTTLRWFLRHHDSTFDLIHASTRLRGHKNSRDRQGKNGTTTWQLKHRIEEMQQSSIINSTLPQLRLARTKQSRKRRLPRIVGFGGEPADRYMPLQICEGDCDDDNDVSKENSYRNVIFCLNVCVCVCVLKRGFSYSFIFCLFGIIVCRWLDVLSTKRRRRGSWVLGEEIQYYSNRLLHS